LGGEAEDKVTSLKGKGGGVGRKHKFGGMQKGGEGNQGDNKVLGSLFLNGIEEQKGVKMIPTEEKSVKKTQLKRNTRITGKIKKKGDWNNVKKKKRFFGGT